MRATLDIDDDVLQAAKELASREGSTVGHIISRLARRGLTTFVDKSTQKSAMRGGVPVLPSRGEVITVEHVQKLRDSEGI